jgi:2',3'-cyclic-nucleotide 2'-phosphodiesterase (5'-nucleotidase family)
MLEGLRDLGLQLANVSGRDLALGPEALRALADSVGVQLVSANILVNDRPWFRPYVLLRRRIGGRDLGIAVTGVTVETRASGWPDSLQVRIVDPLESARTMLATLEPQSDVQVLLAYAPATTVDSWAVSLVGYDLLVAGAGDLREGAKPGPTPLVAAPGTKCKFLQWAALRSAPAGLVVSATATVGLDAQIKDDPEAAKLVQSLKQRLGDTAATTASAPGPVPH